jgi:hypothetical protein
VIWAFVASLYVAFALFLLIVFAEGLLSLLGMGFYYLFTKSRWRMLYGVEREGLSPGDVYYGVTMLLFLVGLPIVVAILLRRKGTRERWVWTLALVPAILGGPLFAINQQSAVAGFSLACGAGVPAALYLAFVAGRRFARSLTGRRTVQPASIRPT